MPKDIPNSEEYAQFTKHGATQRAKILVVIILICLRIFLFCPKLRLYHEIQKSRFRILKFFEPSCDRLREIRELTLF